MKKLQTCILFRSTRRKLCLCYLLFYFSVVTMFSNFQAKFPLISPKILEYSHKISPQKSEKYYLTLGTKSEGFEQNWGAGEIMSHTFNVFSFHSSKEFQMGICTWHYNARYGIVYLCKYFPRLRAFWLMRADYRVNVQVSHHSRGVVAGAGAFLAYMCAHQAENIYKDELYMWPVLAN